MEYTIGQIANMFGLAISTLRYYDKEGLFGEIERKSTVRKFHEKDIETLRVIQCLKKSGLEIKEIKYFMDLCKKGKDTYAERKEIFEKQKAKVIQEIKNLNETLDMINFKCWYYEKAILDGNEDNIKKMKVTGFPEEIELLYNKTHRDLRT